MLRVVQIQLQLLRVQPIIRQLVQEMQEAPEMQETEKMVQEIRVEKEEMGFVESIFYINTRSADSRAPSIHDCLKENDSPHTCTFSICGNVSNHCFGIPGKVA